MLQHENLKISSLLSERQIVRESQTNGKVKNVTQNGQILPKLGPEL